MVADEENVTATPVDCSSQLRCVDCVDSNCAWAIGTCFDSCADIPPGIGCFSFEAYQDEDTADGVCGILTGETVDAATCGTQTTCALCTSTELSSAEGNCSWYEDRGICSHLECDDDGCASPYCPETPEGQCYFGATDCLTCLNDIETQECVWVDDRCELNCTAGDGAVCYTPEDFPEWPNEEICQVANNLAMDTELCQSQLDCESCTTTIKTDGSACEWYFDNVTRVGTCGLGGCDETGLCPIESCDGLPVTPEGFICAPFDGTGEVPTCETCLENQCGWTLADQCLGSCSFLPDATCYSYNNETQTPSIDDVCQTAADDKADEDLCRSKNSCADCTSTFLVSDRTSTCEWYVNEDADREWCGTGKGPMMGVEGSKTCGNPCESIPRCGPCVASSLDCVWIDEECYASSACDDLGDENTVCYGTEEFPDLTPTEICAEASGEVSDGGSNNEGEDTEDEDTEDATDALNDSGAFAPGGRRAANLLASLAGVLLTVLL